MAVALATTALALACTNDFDQFDPIADASAPAEGGAAETSAQDTGADVARDTGTATDAGADGPCVPRQSCFDTAGSCGAACVQQSATCQTNCGNNNGCKQGCRNGEVTCKGGCATSCVTCTQIAGCPANQRCADAANVD